MFIYSFCFSRTRAITQLQSSTTKAWFSFLVGRGSSNTKVFRSSSDIQQHLLPTRFHWGSALPSGQFLPAKGGDHRRRFGSVVVVALWSGTTKIRSFYRRSSVTGDHRRRFGSVVVGALWSGTNKNRSFYRRSSVTVDHHHHLSGQVYWRKLKGKVKCTYWPLREP